MIRPVPALTILALLTMATGSLSAEDRVPGKLRGLMITGGCCHDYANQKNLLAEGISQRASIEWDIVHEGGTSRTHKVSVYQQPGWASKYDVILHNECFGAIEDADFIRGITQAHFEGVPAIFIHCSLHSYRAAGAGADPWRELIGVTSVKHQKHRPVEVQNLQPDHPVMTTFPKAWKTPNGELYEIQRVWPNCTPLAQAFGQDSGKNHVCVWVNTFGKARVFGTSLGHHNETMNTSEYLDMVARGVLWSCRKLDDKGQPLPGYEGTGVKPITLSQKLEPIPDRNVSEAAKLSR
jgi:type 1 glutamine amidotransferase